MDTESRRGDMEPASRIAVKVAAKVATIYVVLGLLWVLGSDLYLYFTAPGEPGFPLLALAKGSAFVIASALVIFLLAYWQNTAAHEERGRRESAERGFRALAESIPDAMLLIDPDTGAIRDANRAAEALFGRSRDALIGLSRSEHTDHADPALADYLGRRRRTGNARAELTMIRGDGSRFPADVSSTVFEDHHGRRQANVVVREITERVERERALEDSQARLSELTELQRSVLNAVFAHIALVDRDGTVQFANERWIEAAGDGAAPTLGAMPGADYLVACREYDGPDADTPRRLAEATQAVLQGQSRRAEFELPYLRAGARQWSRIAITPFASQGQHGAVIAHLDVTDRREAEARMQLITAAFQSTDEAILICDESFLVLEANDAYLRVTGLEKTDAIESKPGFLEIGEQARVIGLALAANGYWQGDLLQRRVTGETFISRATINVVSQKAGEPQRLVITFSDISGLREVEDRIEHLSYHDPLTSLPNREALHAWFEQTRHDAEAGDHKALIYLDLDRFKTVNEAFGHSFGDTLLKAIAGRLKDLIGPRDALARLGADEFIVIADGIGNDRDAAKRAGEILAATAEAVHAGAREFHISACAGIALYPRDGLNLEELLRGADAALDGVKRQGRRGAIGAFRQEMREQVHFQVRVERGLRKAVANGEMTLEYQPVILLSDRVLTGAEALGRWDSPELGRVPPDRFIPVAEDTGMINEIGYWIFDAAFSQAKRWRATSTRFSHLAINVSVAQFQQAGLVEQLETLLARHDLTGDLFRLEITESLMMLDPHWTLEVLERLRSLGFEIAIDDFGTGYSSLSYLRQFPAQFLKLDQGFTRRLPDDATDASIVESTIQLAHRLGMRVVAEGIETEAQMEWLTPMLQ